MPAVLGFVQVDAGQRRFKFRQHHGDLTVALGHEGAAIKDQFILAPEMVNVDGHGAEGLRHPGHLRMAFGQTTNVIGATVDVDVDFRAGFGRDQSSLRA